MTSGVLKPHLRSCHDVVIMIVRRELLSEQVIEETVERTGGNNTGVKQLDVPAAALRGLAKAAHRSPDVQHSSLQTLARKIYLTPDHKKRWQIRSADPERNASDGSYIGGHIITHRPVTPGDSPDQNSVLIGQADGYAVILELTYIFRLVSQVFFTRSPNSLSSS
jgi:hypothetical protein